MNENNTYFEVIQDIVLEANLELDPKRPWKYATPIVMIRFFEVLNPNTEEERFRSIEDFSISNSPYTGEIFYNFTVTDTEDGKVIFKKKNKHSTRHIVFNRKDCKSYDVRINRKRRILEMYVEGDIYYTDGTHRYNKEK